VFAPELPILEDCLFWDVVEAVRDTGAVLGAVAVELLEED